MVEYKVASPVVGVIDFFPKLDLEAGVILEPDEILQFSGQMVYKNAEALRNSIEKAREEGVNLEEVRKKLADWVGRGHASFAAMAGGVFNVEEGSKMFDSGFTGATFSNSHMPSGRRTNVKSAEEEIVVPISIHGAGGRALGMYLETSQDIIAANKALRENGVSKQEAAKILHYGISGGGSILLSVETIADFATFQINQPLPAECKEIISQLEKACRENGALVLLEARKRAKRICYPNTSIFREETENEATEAADRIYQNNGEPVALHVYVPESKGLERRITEYIQLIKKSHESEQSFRDNQDKIYQMARAIAGDFPAFNATIAEFVPWRVWGEDKRHRTVEQVVEPLYHGLGRAEAFMFQTKQKELTPKFVRQFFSVPDSVAEDPKNMGIWTGEIRESLSAYKGLIEAGIDKSDAIYIASRGVMLALVKKYNLYNTLIGGFIPLRMCTTAEPEMRAITNKEAQLFREILPAYMRPLLNPKCYQQGCSEEGFAKCRRAASYMPWYTDEVHERLNNERQSAILAAIDKTKI